jgi:hypothetical protein
MSEPQDPEVPGRPVTDWDRVTAIAAIAIGMVAVSVAAYTAVIQREQVRAQVWPYLLLSNNDFDHTLNVYNKGVGPAIVRGTRVLVDGKPQKDWTAVLDALDVPKPRSVVISTIHENVLSPGERVAIVSLPDADTYRAFRAAASRRVKVQLCYCSTLGECQLYTDGIFGNTPDVRSATQCATSSDDFND